MTIPKATPKAAAKAAKLAAQASKAAAKAAVQAAKLAVKATIAMVKAAIAAIKGLVAIIAAGGWVAVVIIQEARCQGRVVFFDSNPRGGNMVEKSPHLPLTRKPRLNLFFYQKCHPSLTRAQYYTTQTAEKACVFKGFVV
jgi:hypothetical protein